MPGKYKMCATCHGPGVRCSVCYLDEPELCECGRGEIEFGEDVCEECIRDEARRDAEYDRMKEEGLI